jgi:phospholipid/cholesterol/gamma-HCH transport system ATP-binding protein
MASSVNPDIAVGFDRVTKVFDNVKVLDDVSFEVKRGQAFCILGRSGAGKSVTLRQMIGLMQPDSGAIFVQGENVGKLDGAGLTRIRKQVGFLFQYSALFDSISVEENVAFPLRRHTRLRPTEIHTKVGELLSQVGLEQHRAKMPSEISGGMRKRVGLARAMALDPSILLVDEPSSGLDPITALEIDELLLGLRRRGTTIVVVTHNIPSARRIGDKLAFLHEGRILDSGTPAEMENSRQELVQRFMTTEGGT